MCRWLRWDRLAVIRVCHAARYIRLRALLLSLRDYFAGVKLHKHRPVCLEFLNRNGESEVVEEKELQFQMV